MRSPSSHPPPRPRDRLRARGRRLRASIFGLLLAAAATPAHPAEIVADEYRVKASFLLNFATFTTWPASGDETLSICVYGQDPFGTHLDTLSARKVGERGVQVRRVGSVGALDGCQLVFVARPAISNLGRVLDSVRDRPILTVADSPGALEGGVMLNMDSSAGRIRFSANLEAARRSGLGLSSKLLSLATEIKR